MVFNSFIRRLPAELKEHGVTRTSISQGLTALLLVLLSSIGQAANINEKAKLLPNSGEGATLDRMGQSVAVSGDTAVVGAYLANDGSTIDSGTVYVFKRDTADAWSRQQRIPSPSPTSNDLFGNAVAISGNTLVVAAVQDDEASAINAGAVYVFTRSGVSWSLQQRLNASDATANAGFGRSVAIDGDTLVVGAYQAAGTGAAYVFTRSGSTWSQQQRLVGSDTAAADHFGGSVAISGDRLVIGAERADIGVPPNRKVDVGAAYVYRRNGSGPWSEQSKLVPSTYANDDNFGLSVSISGATIVVGQPYLGEGAGSNKGAAIVFVEESGGWNRQATLLASDATADDFFGRSVSISGDIIVAGSYFDDFSAGSNQIVNGGSSYLFRRNGSTWTQSDKLIGSDTELNDLMGSAVAVSGGVSIVGAPFDTNSFGREAGAAYAFTREDGTSTSLGLTATSLTYGGGGTLLTASVAGSPFAAAPTGTITFYNGSTALQSVAVDGNGQAIYNFAAPNAGDLSITARYSGDASHLPSTSPIRSLNVARAATTVALSGGSPSVQYGTALTFTANLSVAGSAPVPAGNIRFLDGATLLGTAPMTAGVATFTVSNLGVGSHSIRAEYAGDSNYAGFTSGASSISVVRASVVMTVTTRPSPSFEGDTVVVQAAIVGGIPTGLNVGFEMISPSSAILGSAQTNSNGIATIVTGSLPIGVYQFRAVYFGDTNHFPASDDSNLHSVLATTNLSITKSNGVNAIQSGDATTYTIVVTNNGPNDAPGATVIDDIDDDLVSGLFLPNSPWTCTASGGAACTGGTSGQGDINLAVDLPVAGSVTIEVVTQSRPDAEPFISNTASVQLPATLGDPDMSNNSSTDSDSSGVFTDGFEGPARR
jgi:uncharacterized repeat protein (TIGR01451 family)